MNGDPVCKHRAAFYLAVGLLDLDPEPQPPAPAVQTVRCYDCLGDGFIKISTGGRFSDWIPATCHRCDRTGEIIVPLAA